MPLMHKTSALFHQLSHPYFLCFVSCSHPLHSPQKLSSGYFLHNLKHHCQRTFPTFSVQLASFLGMKMCIPGVGNYTKDLVF